MVKFIRIRSLVVAISSGDEVHVIGDFSTALNFLFLDDRCRAVGKLLSAVDDSVELVLELAGRVVAAHKVLVPLNFALLIDNDGKTNTYGCLGKGRLVGGVHLVLSIVSHLEVASDVGSGFSVGTLLLSHVSVVVLLEPLLSISQVVVTRDSNKVSALLVLLVHVTENSEGHKVTLVQVAEPSDYGHLIFYIEGLSVKKLKRSKGGSFFANSGVLLVHKELLRSSSRGCGLGGSTSALGGGCRSSVTLGCLELLDHSILLLDVYFKRLDLCFKSSNLVFVTHL
mmetsp:Transcript_12628/g.22507  ORF Transcript_12628/g.22507 Transcript_12628/m.22507 type:complete len:283 (+) Transcript_12628:23-871(+)